jgi:hypothetical protein
MNCVWVSVGHIALLLLLDAVIEWGVNWLVTTWITGVLFRVQTGIFRFSTSASRQVLGPPVPWGNAGAKNALIFTFTPHLLLNGVLSRNVDGFTSYYILSLFRLRSMTAETGRIHWNWKQFHINFRVAKISNWGPLEVVGTRDPEMVWSWHYVRVTRHSCRMRQLYEKHPAVIRASRICFKRFNMHFWNPACNN